MNKKKFNQLLKEPRLVEENDLKLIDKLQADHPYSQVIHALAAKTHFLKKSGNANTKLGIAAMYSSDRAILKNYLHEVIGTTEVKNNQNKPKPIQEEKIVEIPSVQKADAEKANGSDVSRKNESLSSVKNTNKVPELKPIVKPQTYTPNSELLNLYSEVEQNLKELRENIKHFKEVDELYPDKAELSEKEIEKKPAQSSKSKPASKKSPSKDKPVLSKKTKTKDSQQKNEEPTILSEIKALSEKPIGPRQTEQNILIENFITTNPKIQPPESVDPDAETMDLARESVSFKDDLVSENLAVILANQGKRTKAIEIYRKLIWKYPQKKSYFAAQIEILEKN